MKDGLGDELPASGPCICAAMAKLRMQMQTMTLQISRISEAFLQFSRCVLGLDYLIQVADGSHGFGR